MKGKVMFFSVNPRQKKRAALMENKKTQTSQNDEKDEDPVEPGISSEALEAVAEEGKACIAESGNRVKKRQKSSAAGLPTPAPGDKKQNGSDPLDGERVQKDVPDERCHIFGSGVVEFPLNEKTFGDGNFPAGDKEDKGGERHDSQPSEL